MLLTVVLLGLVSVSMRQTRIKMESSVYHCMTRIVGGDFLLEGDREKEVFRKQIWKVSAFCGVEVLTYCKMYKVNGERKWAGIWEKNDKQQGCSLNKKYCNIMDIHTYYSTQGSD